LLCQKVRVKKGYKDNKDKKKNKIMESRDVSLLNIIPENTQKGKQLRKIIENQDLYDKSYKGRQEHAEFIEKQKKETPPKALKILMDLQLKIDEAIQEEDLGVLEELNELMFNIDNDNNLMMIMTDLIGIVNDSIIPEVKRQYTTPKKISRAEKLARAHDPLNKDWDFCLKCSRPMRSCWIEEHQKNTSICVEIKAGRKKTLELQNARCHSIGNFIADQVFHDDSDDEENPNDPNEFELIE
jgi:hypothetical protein